MKHLYFCGWPSSYGGADTKTAHLLDLLAGHVPITVIPNSKKFLAEKHWTDFLDERGINYSTYQDLSPKLDGVALALCNPGFLAEGLINHVKRAELPIVWSSEMAWHLPFEKKFIEIGFIDRLLYVSEVQKRALDYESFCDVPTFMTGNFINPKFFPFRDRETSSTLVLGRLSRADPKKFPDDFPQFYESLLDRDVRFRVMAWSDEMAEKFSGHRFDHRWELLEKCAEPTAQFLQSLDLFVYDLGPEVIESWGRSTVEAMLSGAIPLVPTGHNFHELIVDGVTGYLCNDRLEFKQRVEELAHDKEKRRAMPLACREYAVENLCDLDQHLAMWLAAIDI